MNLVTQKKMSIVDKIKSGGFSRSEILKLRENAQTILKKKPSDEKALAVIESINHSALSELQTRYFFVAFKPHSKIEDAVDEQWYAGGFYDLQYYEDPVQMGYYHEILCGDVVITKTNATTVRTPGEGKMRVFAHGKVTEIVDSDRNNHRWYKVDWKHPAEFLEVPLMGCTKAISHRDIELVEDRMPQEFWEWLASGS